MNDPTNFRKYKLVDELGTLSDDAFEALTEEQVTLYLARAGMSPLDVEASLDRCFERLELERRQEQR